jgi:hypothetical protein
LVLPVLPVIRALVTFLSPDNGGRAKMPGLASGQYMPHLVIQSPDVRKANVINGNVIVEDYLGVRFLSAPAEMLAEQPLDCEMELTYFPRVDYSAVREGATFTVREGGKVIGFGVVSTRSG